MKIHHYNADNGEYLGEGQADESPLEPGVFLVPAHATATAPPAAQAGKVRAFEGGAWVQRDIPVPQGPPVKTQAELDAEAAAAAKAAEMQIAIDALPALVAYVAAKADAPAEIKTKAAAMDAAKVTAK